MRTYWQLLDSIREHCKKQALASGGKVVDVGGRKDAPFMDGAVTAGWEGEERCDLEDGVYLAGASYAFCRHTTEDLHNPDSLLDDLSLIKVGYLETPSPLAELTRNIDNGEHVPYRGYIHHKWFVGVQGEQLVLIPKLPCVEHLEFPAADASRGELKCGPLHWNTYFEWSPERPLKFRILRHGRDFDLTDTKRYVELVEGLVKSTIAHNEANWKEIVGGPVLLESPIARMKTKWERTVSTELPSRKREELNRPEALQRRQPEPPSYRLMFARFPGGHVDRDDVTDWLVGAVLAAKSDPRISDVLNWRRSDTPITMTRNLCIEVAKKEKIDFLVMVDNDMKPDAYLESNPYKLALDRASKPFFQSSLDFAIRQREAGGPCVIGAPYCGPPPIENVYVFQWGNSESDCPEDTPDLKLDQFTREHAAAMRGITEVGALPTGLILIDMQAIAHTDPPYFYYEWADETESEKASTEDVTFTRDLGLNRVPQFCNWDAWAGHWKQKCVGRPVLHSARSLNRRLRNRVLAEYNIKANEELVIVGRNGKHERPGRDPGAGGKPIGACAAAAAAGRQAWGQDGPAA